MKKAIFPQILALLAACDAPPPAPPHRDPPAWSNEAELLFQQAEVLRYELERRRLERERLRERGIQGAPPHERAAISSSAATVTTGPSRP